MTTSPLHLPKLKVQQPTLPHLGFLWAAVLLALGQRAGSAAAAPSYSINVYVWLAYNGSLYSFPGPIGYQQVVKQVAVLNSAFGTSGLPFTFALRGAFAVDNPAWSVAYSSSYDLGQFMTTDYAGTALDLNIYALNATAASAGSYYYSWTIASSGLYKDGIVIDYSTFPGSAYKGSDQSLANGGAAVQAAQRWLAAYDGTGTFMPTTTTLLQGWNTYRLLVCNGSLTLLDFEDVGLPPGNAPAGGSTYLAAYHGLQWSSINVVWADAGYTGEGYRTATVTNRQVMSTFQNATIGFPGGPKFFMITMVGAAVDTDGVVLHLTGYKDGAAVTDTAIYTFATDERKLLTLNAASNRNYIDQLTMQLYGPNATTPVGNGLAFDNVCLAYERAVPVPLPKPTPAPTTRIKPPPIQRPPPLPPRPPAPPTNVDPVQPAPTNFPGSPGCLAIWEVQTRDTCAHIAAASDISLAGLQALNVGVTPRLNCSQSLMVGQQLCIATTNTINCANTTLVTTDQETCQSLALDAGITLQLLEILNPGLACNADGSSNVTIGKAVCLPQPLPTQGACVGATFTITNITAHLTCDQLATAFGMTTPQLTYLNPQLLDDTGLVCTVPPVGTKICRGCSGSTCQVKISDTMFSFLNYPLTVNQALCALLVECSLTTQPITNAGTVNETFIMVINELTNAAGAAADSGLAAVAAFFDPATGAFFGYIGATLEIQVSPNYYTNPSLLNGSLGSNTSAGFIAASGRRLASSDTTPMAQLGLVEYVTNIPTLEAVPEPPPPAPVRPPPLLRKMVPTPKPSPVSGGGVSTHAPTPVPQKRTVTATKKPSTRRTTKKTKHTKTSTKAPKKTVAKKKTTTPKEPKKKTRGKATKTTTAKKVVKTKKTTKKKVTTKKTTKKKVTTKKTAKKKVKTQKAAKKKTTKRNTTKKKTAKRKTKAKTAVHKKTVKTTENKAAKRGLLAADGPWGQPRQDMQLGVTAHNQGVIQQPSMRQGYPHKLRRRAPQIGSGVDPQAGTWRLSSNRSRRQRRMTDQMTKMPTWYSNGAFGDASNARAQAGQYQATGPTLKQQGRQFSDKGSQNGLVAYPHEGAPLSGSTEVGQQGAAARTVMRIIRRSQNPGCKVRTPFIPLTRRR